VQGGLEIPVEVTVTMTYSEKNKAAMVWRAGRDTLSGACEWQVSGRYCRAMIWGRWDIHWLFLWWLNIRWYKN
jgi:hypothetical protein